MSARLSAAMSHDLPTVPDPGPAASPGAVSRVSPLRRRAVRVGAAAALAAVGLVAVGGAVAWAVAGDDEPAADQTGGQAHVHDEAAGGSDGSGATAAAAAPGRRAHHPAHRPGAAGHRHEPLPAYDERYADASAEERAAADELLVDVRATLESYADVDAALAAGYQAPRHPHSARRHYLNPSVAEDGAVLDPTRPNGLIYYTPDDADPVLVGAFFIAPPGTPAPTPAGDLAVWHSHNPSCTDFFATPDAPCTDVRRMLHVWTVDQLEVVSRRTGEPVELDVTDPFGTPFRASVAKVT
jgi:hypothetical protein